MRNIGLKVVLGSLILVFFSSCQQKSQIVSENQALVLRGRIDKIAEDSILMIGASSSVSFSFTGDSCEIFLQSVDSWNHHNYVSVVVDGVYQNRVKVEKGNKKSYIIPITKKASSHEVQIYKATEASVGQVMFAGARVKSFLLPRVKNKKRIEFIGNSITSGMGNDDAEIPCGVGEWFDQHNAYWSYGSILSRELGVDYILSSVSGIGVYRGWNDENENQNTMPQVYKNLYLNLENETPFQNHFQPDIVSICLGTNDLSDGDGVKFRLPFDRNKFMSNYILFIKSIFERYPNTQIILLNSPMLDYNKNKILVDCLSEVIKHFNSNKMHHKIHLFQFSAMTPKGCTAHPDIENHKVMAQELFPFYKKVLDNVLKIE
jgi:lysophospholipase L1-like esterase